MERMERECELKEENVTKERQTCMRGKRSNTGGKGEVANENGEEYASRCGENCRRGAVGGKVTFETPLITSPELFVQRLHKLY